MPRRRPKTLEEFMKEARREDVIRECKVCQLPRTIREQLQQLRALKIQHEVALRWLAEECGITGITSMDLTKHTGGRHEQRYRQ